MALTEQNLEELKSHYQERQLTALREKYSDEMIWTLWKRWDKPLLKPGSFTRDPETGEVTGGEPEPIDEKGIREFSGPRVFMSIQEIDKIETYSDLLTTCFYDIFINFTKEEDYFSHIFDYEEEERVNIRCDTLDRVINTRLKNLMKELEDMGLDYFQKIKDFRGANCQNFCFKGGSLYKAHFDAANLFKTNFDFSDLKSASFIGVNLREANFRKANCDETTFNGSICFLTRFDKTLFDNCSFELANCFTTCFLKTKFYKANFFRANCISFQMEEADCVFANFDRAFCSNANFMKSQLKLAIFTEANINLAKFDEANCEFASFSDADCCSASFNNANLKGADFSFSKITCSTYINADVNIMTNFRNTDPIQKNWPMFNWSGMVETYIQIKNAFKNRGYYDEAGKYYFREMHCRRMAGPTKEYKSKVWNWLYRAYWNTKEWLKEYTIGYGEKPWLMGLWVIGTVFAFSGIFSATGYQCATNGAEFHFWPKALYLSVVTFATLGYGDYSPFGFWGKFAASFEALLGLLFVGLFVVSMARKIIRD